MRIIESYPDDFPCPSVLMFGFLPGKPCHVVVAKCLDYLRVVTVYLPDEDEWINCREEIMREFRAGKLLTKSLRAGEVELKMSAAI